MRELERWQAKKISAALTGKKPPPTSAVVKKLKEKAMSYYDTCAFPKLRDKKKKKNATATRTSQSASAITAELPAQSATRSIQAEESARSASTTDSRSTCAKTATGKYTGTPRCRRRNGMNSGK